MNRPAVQTHPRFQFWPIILPVALALLAMALVAIRSIAADGNVAMPPAPPVSKFAPVDDLTAQVEFYLKRIDGVLEDKDDFDDASVTRLKKDANTLAVLGLVLALHDKDNRFKNGSGDLIKAAQSLAAASDYDSAHAAYLELKKAANGESASDSTPKEWQKVASLGQLMKQVPTINTQLKRGVGTADRLKRMQNESAGHAAALAAIAQASMADTHEVKNPADMDKWYQCCAEMRDAAGEVNAAVREGDHAKTTAAMLRLAKSCETCHQAFRIEGK